MPGQMMSGSQHLVVAGDVDILQGQGVFPTVDPEVHVFQGRDAFRQAGLQLDKHSFAEVAAVFFGPGGGEGDVRISVYIIYKRLVAQMLRGTVSMLGGNRAVVVRLIPVRIGALFSSCLYFVFYDLSLTITDCR